MRLAREALTLARETRDPEALASVLARGWVLIDGSTPFLDELQALNDEAEVGRPRGREPGRLADALHDGAYYAACRGDRATFEEKLDEAARIYGTLRRPIFDWVVTQRRHRTAPSTTANCDRAEQLADADGRARPPRRRPRERHLRRLRRPAVPDPPRAGPPRRDGADCSPAWSESTPDIPLLRLVLHRRAGRDRPTRRGPPALRMAHRQRLRERSARPRVRRHAVRARALRLRPPATHGAPATTSTSIWHPSRARSTGADRRSPTPTTSGWR